MIEDIYIIEREALSEASRLASRYLREPKSP